MVIVFAVAILLCIGGALCILYELIQIFLWFRAEKIDAEIVDVDDMTGNHGLLRYYYRINIEGNEQVIKGPVSETFNPFRILFPKMRVGKHVFIKISKKKKIIQPPLIAAIISLFLVVILICGLAIIIMHV